MPYGLYLVRKYPMISILHLINLNDLVISVIKKKKKIKQTNKTKQKQISKIEEPNILIENPNTQNKNKSNLNPKKKKIRVLRLYETTFHNLIGNMD